MWGAGGIGVEIVQEIEETTVSFQLPYPADLLNLPSRYPNPNFGVCEELQDVARPSRIHTRLEMTPLSLKYLA